MSEKPVRDPQAAPELAFSNVCKSYGRAHSLLQRFGVPMPRRVVAVDGVSFTLRKGETLALVGESGCGKSTIARLAVGLERPDSGTVLLDGAELGGRNRPQRRGSPPQMIFQDPYASLDPHWRVDRILAEPLRARGIARDSADRACRIADWLRQVGLTPADGRKYPHEFSGGQRQRISIARALAAQPELLVCDEPTSALDVSVQAQVLNLLLGLRDRLGLACLFISHDLAVVYQVSDYVGVLYLGRLVELAPASRLFAAPRHPYTRMLLDAVPRLEEPGVTAAPIPGEVPDPFRRPAGCCFHPRCAFATERCRTERPKLLADRDGEVACHAVAEGRLPPYEYRAIAAGA